MMKNQPFNGKTIMEDDSFPEATGVLIDKKGNPSGCCLIFIIIIAIIVGNILYWITKQIH